MHGVARGTSLLLLHPMLHGCAGGDHQTASLHGGARQSASLDGEWNFTLREPKAPGFSDESGTITVPGSWEAQGFGNETIQMWHQVRTGDNVKGTKGAVGIYTRTVSLDECAVSGARAVFMVDPSRCTVAYIQFAQAPSTTQNPHPFRPESSRSG